MFAPLRHSALAHSDQHVLLAVRLIPPSGRRACPRFHRFLRG